MAERKFPTGTLFATIVFIKSAATLPPAFGLTKNRKKSFPAENARHFLTAILTEKTTAAAIAVTAVPAETIAEAAEIAPAAACENRNITSER